MPNLCRINLACYNPWNIKESQNIWFVAIFILHGLLMKKTSPFNDKIILEWPSFINSPVFTMLQTSPLYDFHYLFYKSEFQAMGRYSSAVLLLIFLSLHLIALSIMWTVWDYNTWYEKLVGGHYNNSYVEMKIWHTHKSIFQFFHISNFGPTIIYYY